MAIVQTMLTYQPQLIVAWNSLVTTGLLPGPGGWSVTNNNRTIRYDIQDSSNCGGSNPNTQTGSATAVIITDNRSYTLNPVVTGNVELGGANFDRLFLNLNTVDIIRAVSAGGGSGCAMGAPSITNLVAPPYTLPANSRSTLIITFTTIDGLFHLNSFYNLVLQLTPI